MLKTLRNCTMSVYIAGFVTMLLLFVLGIQAQGKHSPGITRLNSAAPQVVTPTILLVHPQQSPNNLDTTIVITGTGFQAELTGTLVLTEPSVYLNDFVLPIVGWVSSNTLTAIVPWGLDPDTYTLTVVNPDGGIGSLTNAFTVEQAIGVWTTGGPYGGAVLDLVVSPVTSETAFAAVMGAGVFWTQDGGGQWNLVVEDMGPSGLTYGPGSRLYYWGNSGLRRSTNDGDDWELLIQHEDFNACAPDPQQEERVWIGNQEGVWLLTIQPGGGIDRERRDEGLPTDTGVSLLVVDPVSSSVVYAGLQDGRVFKTTNSGVGWEDASDGLAPPDSLHAAQAMAIHPQDPEVILFSRGHAQVAGYRSDNGGDSWTEVDIGPPDNQRFTDLAFSPHVSGTVYASLMGESLMVVSEDGGETWAPLGERTGDWMLSLGLYPTSGLPAYLGGGASGAYRSDDGGETWALATKGISSLMVEGIAASRANPATVRVAAEHAGAFASENAGQSWRQLGLSFPAAFALAVDPVDPDVAYIGSVGGVYRMGDGETWERVSLPVTYSTMIHALAVSPVSPSVVYAGGRDDDAFQFDQDVGMLFRSDNAGESWSVLDIGQPISIVYDIAVAPTVTGTVYVATNNWASGGISGPGLGVVRSADDGAWETVLETRVRSLAIRPDDGQTVYAAGAMTNTSDWTVFKSEDGGDSWTPTPLRMGWHEVVDLAIDPLAPDTVYAGTEGGLYRSTDGGASWSRAASTFGNVGVEGLAIAALEERTILYVGTIGGFPSGETAQRRGSMERMEDTFVQAGVYQQTIIHHWVYLPIVLRR
jgi:photosystem II stability/assembly factor-like uncharacterized protein